MGFEDFFDNRRGDNGNYRGNFSNDERRYPDESHTYKRGNNEQINWQEILEKIKGNNKLKMFVILAGILVLIIAVILIIVLMPFITKLLNTISQTGIQGIFDSITGFIDKLWKGTAG
jgi:uncharacterized protein YqhQ